MPSGGANKTHGESNSGGMHKASPEYVIWLYIKQRCYNQKRAAYKDYGGRGIKICTRWRKSFEAFVTDVGRRPSLDLEIDRIDNDGDYAPGNVRWATKKDNCGNRRSSILITFSGKTQCITAWARELHMHPMTLHKRFRKGWSTKEALTPTLRVNQYS